jgi:hypothetical protein
MKNFIFEVIKMLTVNKVDFVICGGVACILQGCDRSTYDLDLNILLNDDNLKNAIKVFKNMGFMPRIPEPFEALLDENKRSSWIKDKNAIVYTVISNDGFMQVDIFLNYSIDYEELKNNSDKYNVEGIDVFVSSKKDLIKAKKVVKPLREKDIYDIKQLEDLIINEKKSDR